MTDVSTSLYSLIAVAERHDPHEASRLKSLIGSAPDPIAIARNREIWGGMGSVMDQLGVMCPSGRTGRREIEAAAIRLAEALRAAGAESTMVAQWEEVFRRWRDQGI